MENERIKRFRKRQELKKKIKEGSHFNSIANEYMRNRIQYNKSLIFENKKRIEQLESKLDDSIGFKYGLTG